jgi:hypothetical protein
MALSASSDNLNKGIAETDFISAFCLCQHERVEKFGTASLRVVGKKHANIFIENNINFSFS